MSALGEKRRIGAAFAAAASAYDRLAVVQRRIADALLAQRPKEVSGLMLDAGCGTGYLGRQLQVRYPDLDLLSCDLAIDMLRLAPATILCGDLEHLPLPAASLGLYASSLAWQWADAPRAVAEAARCLRPGGHLLVASLGPASLGELRQAFSAVDRRTHVRDFMPVAQLMGLFHPDCWSQASVEVEVFREYAPDLSQLLHGVRGLGAGVLPARPPGLYGKAAWQQMAQAYEALREPAGLPISYEAVFIRATRT